MGRPRRRARCAGAEGGGLAVRQFPQPRLRDGGPVARQRGLGARLGVHDVWPLSIASPRGVVLRRVRPQTSAGCRWRWSLGRSALHRRRALRAQPPAGPLGDHVGPRGLRQRVGGATFTTVRRFFEDGGACARKFRFAMSCRVASGESSVLADSAGGRHPHEQGHRLATSAPGPSKTLAGEAFGVPASPPPGPTSDVLQARPSVRSPSRIGDPLRK